MFYIYIYRGQQWSRFEFYGGEVAELIKESTFIDQTRIYPNYSAIEVVEYTHPQEGRFFVSVDDH